MEINYDCDMLVVFFGIGIISSLMILEDASVARDQAFCECFMMPNCNLGVFLQTLEV